MASLDKNASLSAFSCHGRDVVQLAAPGRSLLSTLPTPLYPSGYGFMR